MGFSYGSKLLLVLTGLPLLPISLTMVLLEANKKSSSASLLLEQKEATTAALCSYSILTKQRNHRQWCSTKAEQSCDRNLSGEVF